MVSGPCVSSKPCMNRHELPPADRAKHQRCHRANRRMMHRLAAQAFRNILGKKQSKYRHVIRWLDEAIWRTKPDNATETRRLNRVVKEGDAVFLDYKF